ncbi:hypothetical protein [Deinococcus multiflagellatus]|uniref:Uncharacterized protein n=1 Tax=Deinococcus multiflagellatus TaxID=1656887 RepID=A0ABW1ZKR3_9DEIO|nr:hypothetical protein [Deinococcus multiflagellatus]MBZ9713750.1 hypothetical protein [Deinococcus multiflagellatus]
MREYGAAAYASVIVWPYRLILRGIEIERQREAAHNLARLRLQAVADGLDQGREYVPDPNDPAPTSTAHYTLKPYLTTLEQLDEAAHPWRYTLEMRIRRREREEAAAFDELERAIGRLPA